MDFPLILLQRKFQINSNLYELRQNKNMENESKYKKTFSSALSVAEDKINDSLDNAIKLKNGNNML